MEEGGFQDGNANILGRNVIKNRFDKEKRSKKVREI
jgi:hypothetical protein